ncbi:MAG TPA: ATP-binding protein [Candidatus Acidoferrum sp.]|nr:ATP-binding protein [Candidatus Acidoferrum sp.]
MKENDPANDVVLAAVEREQQRIGAVLHEKLCQTLAGVSIQLDVMSRRLSEGEQIDSADLTELGNHVHQAIDDARAVAGDLRLASLRGVGLMEALHKLAETTAAEVPCEYVCEKPVFVNDSKAALALFRIAEEAVTNALKHASAASIVLSLIRTSNGITLRIRDDGHAFKLTESGEAATGIGLMRRRARQAGARLNISSERGVGTTVSCVLIFSPAAEQGCV